MYMYTHFQGENGEFEIFLVTLDDQAFDVFEPVPATALNEASVLLRVKNSTALDFEAVKQYKFKVHNIMHIYLHI